MYRTKRVVKQGDSICLYQSTWLVEETLSFNEVTICGGANIIAPEGKCVTLTVDGVGRQMVPGTYAGEVALSVSDTCLMEPHGLMRVNQIARELHCAVCVKDGKVIPEKTIPAIINGGSVADGKTEGVYVASDEESFNGIVVTGDGEYEISNVKMDLDGFGDNDFLGVGSGVAVVDNAKVTINDSEFNVNGVTRCAVHVGGDSDVTLNNCKLFNHSPDTDWLGGFSWQVGFCGSNRLAQLCDNASVTYNNCYLKSNGWGVCSIDGSDEGVRMLVKDSYMELSGPRAHGYGAFCIGDNEITFDHSTVDVTGYPMLVMGMEGQGRPSIKNGCDIRGRRFGAMVISDDNSVFTISDSKFRTGKSTICVKGSATTINISNCDMKADNNVIIQLMDPDESGMNVREYKIPVGEADAPIAGRGLSAVSNTEDVIVNLSDMTVSGDFYNSTTNIRAYTRNAKGGMGHFHDSVIGLMAHWAVDDGEPKMSPVQMRHNGDDLRGPKNLGLNLKNARVEGVISAASQKYRDWLKVITEDCRRELSNVTQTAAEPVNNGVVVNLDKDSEWTVTGTSYITALSIAPGAVVKAPGGRKLVMTVDGAITPAEAGSYAGKIALAVE